MAIGLGSWSNLASTWTSNATGGAWAHSISGSNVCLFVGVSIYSATARTVSGITCSSDSMTLVGRITATLESSNQTTELWYLDNPASGTPTITVTLSGQADFLVCQAISYTGKTVAGLDAWASAQGLTASNPSPDNNVTVVHDDCWIVGVSFSRLVGTPSAGAGTSVRIASSVGHAMGDSNGVVAAGARTLKFAGGSATYPGLITASISAANAGGGGGGAVSSVPPMRAFRPAILNL